MWDPSQGVRCILRTVNPPPPHRTGGAMESFPPQKTDLMADLKVVESGGRVDTRDNPSWGFLVQKGATKLSFWYTRVHKCSICGEARGFFW